MEDEEDAVSERDEDSETEQEGESENEDEETHYFLGKDKITTWRREKLAPRRRGKENILIHLRHLAQKEYLTVGNAYSMIIC
ncbi:hypothetical protein QE152_g34321 [Popillia japonica]|uniref:Uncharacterized protein n=1 Tax=Popillia japonica TaxID=7064 RepID=A0AAW1IUT1_POPJA